MSKFDTIFEDAMFSLREQKDLEIADSTDFATKVTELAKAIKAFLPKKATEQRTINAAVLQALNSEYNVMTLDTSVTKQISLKVTQPKGPGSFEVKIEGKDVPKQANGLSEIVISDTQWSENIYKEVYDKLNFLTISSPDDAVTKLPTQETPGSQPGAEQSALPGAAEEKV